MATLSSHILNGTDGTHAGGIAVSLRNLTLGQTLFEAATDPGGRLVQEIDLLDGDPEDIYELVFLTGAYWAERRLPQDGPQILQEIVLRFQMPDAEKRYHLPIIINPNSYSCWWSA